MTTLPGYETAPVTGDMVRKPADAADKMWVRRLAEKMNGMLGGKLNVVLPITLADGAAFTIIQDARIGPYSALLLEPLTANAAALQYAAPYILPSNQKNGSVQFNHANTANADQDFYLAIIG